MIAKPQQVRVLLHTPLQNRETTSADLFADHKFSVPHSLTSCVPQGRPIVLPSGIGEGETTA